MPIFLYTQLILEKENLFLKNFVAYLGREELLFWLNHQRNIPRNALSRIALNWFCINEGKFTSLIKKWFFYPFTYHFGLKFIESQLKNGIWRAVDSAELCDEVRANGYTVNSVEPVYAGSATLITAS